MSLSLYLGEAEKDEHICSILSELSRENLSTLKFILEHLFEVQKHEDENKMSAKNLAIIFSATLFNPDPDDDEVAAGDDSPEIQLTKELIEHPEFVPIL